MAEEPLGRLVDARELDGYTFRCLEGCGFCCTFQPEVSPRELALLRKRFAPQPVRIASGEGQTFLALQNKCGACTLLSARGCTAYDLRPAHCRYFPFHVHFDARGPAVSVNYTCRGVERAAAAGASLQPAFAASVLAVAKEDELRAHERDARAAYGEFERRARKADAWSDAAATLAQAKALGAAALRGEGIEAMTQRAGEPLARDAMLADALRPFAAADVTKRPFYLAPDLKWLTFERQGDGLRVLEMDEKGELLPRGEVRDITTWRDAPDALAPYLHALMARPSFVGSAYAIVDDAGYDTTVEEATWWRVAEVATDLAARASVLRGLGVAERDLAEETARFYDSAFLDAPTIGGWL